MALENNATSGHCVVCGVQAARDLCRRCLAQYATNGKAPAWLLALQTDQQARHRRETRNDARRQRQPDTATRRGPKRASGVSILSLEALRNKGVEI